MAPVDLEKVPGRQDMHAEDLPEIAPGYKASSVGMCEKISETFLTIKEHLKTSMQVETKSWTIVFSGMRIRVLIRQFTR